MTRASHVRSDKALVAGKERDVTGIDPATIARFYTFDWTNGSERSLRRARRRRRARDRRTTPTTTTSRSARRSRSRRPSGDKRTVVVRGIYDPPETQLLGDDQHRAAGVRRAFPQPEERVHVPRRRTAAPPRRSKAAAAGFSDADAPHRRRVREGLHEGLRQLPEDALRAARLLGRREPVRDGQHARAHRLRAHARARDAARRSA